MNPESEKATINQLPKHCATILGVVAAMIVSILGTRAILNSTSSTAAIGFIILPFLAAIVLVVFAFVGFWIGVIAQGIADSNYRYKPRFFWPLLSLFLSCFILCCMVRNFTLSIVMLTALLT